MPRLGPTLTPNKANTTRGSTWKMRKITIPEKERERDCEMGIEGEA